MKMQDVVVTGIGAVTPIGRTVREFWESACAGRSGASKITQFDPAEAGIRSHITCEVPYDLTEHDRTSDRRMARHTQLSVIAADEAVTDAELDPDSDEWCPNRVGTSIGAGIGGFPEIEATMGKRPSTRFIPRLLSNLASSHVSMEFTATGPNRCSATACAAGTNAIIDAARDIETGAADVMIAGGTESALNSLCVHGFDVMRALSTRNDDPEGASRPFDTDRDGFVIGEGAGVVVLESREHAEERNAAMYATVEGYARSADAFHETRPPDDASGMIQCLENAIAHAGVSPADIDHVNTHGTSTPVGDAHEATALNAVFDRCPPVTSIKSMIGHTLGASGAIEAVALAKSLTEQRITPTINYETPDPECDVPVVDSVCRTEIDVAVSTSAGFGGTNGVLVLGRAR